MGVGDLSDFIEKQSPAVGVLKTSYTVTESTRKCPPRMTEKLALEKFRRNRPAVDPYQRPVSATAEVMDGLRDQFFSGARFPEDQHCGIGRRDHAYLLK
jgi:hypothetical protein